ncbi:MAG: glycerol-3-phosphate 1-O-acyltransferase PlsY [Dehalococcoidia bacterium]
MTFLALLLLAYLLGSIPTGPILVKWLKDIDIRKYGSGNTGAANVLRIAGPGPAAVVLTVDLIKGVIPAAIARSTLTAPLGHVVIGLVAVMGHVWSVFLGFKGGKGVLTALGSLFALAPLAGLVSTAVGGIVMARTRYSSLGSLTGTMMGAVCLLLLIAAQRKPVAYMAQVMIAPALILLTHRENVALLLAGRERKLTQGAERHR